MSFTESQIHIVTFSGNLVPEKSLYVTEMCSSGKLVPKTKNVCNIFWLECNLTTLTGEKRKKMPLKTAARPLKPSRCSSLSNKNPLVCVCVLVRCECVRACIFVWPFFVSALPFGQTLSGPLRLRVQSRSRKRSRIAASIAFSFLSSNQRARSLRARPHKRVTLIKGGFLTTEASIKIKHFRRGTHLNGRIH